MGAGGLIVTEGTSIASQNSIRIESYSLKNNYRLPALERCEQLN